MDITFSEECIINCEGRGDLNVKRICRPVISFSIDCCVGTSAPACLSELFMKEKCVRVCICVHSCVRLTIRLCVYVCVCVCVCVCL